MPPPTGPHPPAEPLRGLISEDLSLSPEELDRYATLSGKLLDRRYQVGQRLGEGGMSYVYRAQDIETGRPVAVKMLLPRLSRDPAAVERLRREAEHRHAARPSQRLPHPAAGRDGGHALPGDAVSSRASR